MQPSNPRTFLSLKKETLYLLSGHFPFPLCPVPDTGLLKFRKESYEEVLVLLSTEEKKKKNNDATEKTTVTTNPEFNIEIEALS